MMTFTNNRLNRILNDEQIRMKAPSIFAENAWEGNSERYRFLPTISVVNALRDLWKTSNVILENIIKGGIMAQGSTGKHSRTRAVQCIKNNVDINKALWRLTEELAKIKA